MHLRTQTISTRKTTKIARVNVGERSGEIERDITKNIIASVVNAIVSNNKERP